MGRSWASPLGLSNEMSRRSRIGTGEDDLQEARWDAFTALTSSPALLPQPQILRAWTQAAKWFICLLLHKRSLHTIYFYFFGVRDQTLYRVGKYSNPNYTPNSQYILLQSSPTFYSLSHILHIHRHVGRLIGLWWQIETGRTKQTMEWINWKSSLSADNTTSP